MFFSVTKFFPSHYRAREVLQLNQVCVSRNAFPSLVLPLIWKIPENNLDVLKFPENNLEVLTTSYAPPTSTPSYAIPLNYSPSPAIPSPVTPSLLTSNAKSLPLEADILYY
ncbi:hypothetical protein Tco_1358277 [Tanacetum coccineum]